MYWMYTVSLSLQSTVKDGSISVKHQHKPRERRGKVRWTNKWCCLGVVWFVCHLTGCRVSIVNGDRKPSLHCLITVWLPFSSNRLCFTPRHTDFLTVHAKLDVMSANVNSDLLINTQTRRPFPFQGGLAWVISLIGGLLSYIYWCLTLSAARVIEICNLDPEHDNLHSSSWPDYMALNFKSYLARTRARSWVLCPWQSHVPEFYTQLPSVQLFVPQRDPLTDWHNYGNVCLFYLD